MAHYEHLPVYKKAFDLLVQIEQVVRDFPRYHKYAIGADLRRLARGLGAQIIFANSQRERERGAALTTLRDQCEELKMLIVVAKELKVFKNFGQFQKVSQLAVELSRQSQGWLNHQAKRPESSTAESRR